ncbi:hypothetical protein GCM10027440_03560 [Nocardiopsis coralliicola]
MVAVSFRPHPRSRRTAYSFPLPDVPGGRRQLRDPDQTLNGNEEE